MAADRKSLNKQAIEQFASHFDPPLKVTATERIGGAHAANAWMCALHSQEHEIGLTAVCWGKGHFKAWLEATGTAQDADFSGQVMAELLDMLTRPSGRACGPGAGETDIPGALPSESLSPPQPPSTQPESPNPNFIDMMGLSMLERATLRDEFPQLRFSIGVNGGQRYDSEGNPDDTAGYARADQLEHVRRIIQDKNSSALAAFGDDSPGR